MKNSLLFLSLLLASQVALAQSYCIPSGTACNTSPYGDPFFISDIYVLQQTGVYFPPYGVVMFTNTCPSGGYKDETGYYQVMSLGQGQAFSIGVDVGQGSHTYNMSGALWIDYNLDGVFNNTNELIGLVPMGTGSPYFNYTVPAGINSGMYRARFRLLRDANVGAGDACVNFVNPSDTRDFKLKLYPTCFQVQDPSFQTGIPAPYLNYFNSVTLSSSSGSTTNTSSYIYAGYSDFKNGTAVAPFGGPATVSGNLTLNTNGYFSQVNVGVWADWNMDNDFADAGEQIGIQTLNTNFGTSLAFSQSLTIPTSVVVPKITIRVMTSYANITGPCSVSGNNGIWCGETEDYSLKLTSPSGFLAAGNQTLCSPADPAPIGFAVLPTYSSAYAWYYQNGIITPPTGLSTAGWVLISGATGTSYDPPAGLTASRTYACFVTRLGFFGNPNTPTGWAIGARQVKVITKNCRVAVDDEANEMINVITQEQGSSLSQNIPNPFSSESAISCLIPEETKTASLEIYGFDGRKVHQVNIPGRGNREVVIQSKMLPSNGIYFYTLVLDGQKQAMKRMVLVH